jgi:hypothetical protein
MNSTCCWHTAAKLLLIAQFGAVATYASTLAASPAVSPAYPVAGLTPYQRPHSAPVLTASQPLDTGQALHGVSSPIPASLKFLKDQGGWFNPFSHPGMTGPYDLRGWHLAPPQAAEKK